MAFTDYQGPRPNCMSEPNSHTSVPAGTAAGKLSVAFLVKATISLGLLAFLLYEADSLGLAQILSELDWIWFLFAYLMIWGTFLVHTLRWQWLLRGEGTRVSFLPLLSYYMIGFMFGQFLPTSIGGDAVRALYVARFGLGKSRSLAIVLLGRLIGTLALAALMIPCALYNEPVIERLSVSSSTLLFWTMLLMIALVGAYFFLSSSLARNHFLSRVTRLDKFATTFARYRGRYFVLAMAFLVSLLHQTMMLCLHFFASRAVGIDLNFTTVAFFAILVSLLTLLPVSVNGIGLREGGFAYLLGTVGIPLHTALSFSLVVYALLILMAAGGGIAFLAGAKNRKNLSGDRRVEELLATE